MDMRWKTFSNFSTILNYVLARRDPSSSLPQIPPPLPDALNQSTIFVSLIRALALPLFSSTLKDESNREVLQGYFRSEQVFANNGIQVIR